VFDYNFHWRPVFRDLPDLIAASLVTLQVAALAMILGVIIGLILALIRMHGRGPLRWFATTWVELARNTPALIQLFFFGFGLGACKQRCNLSHADGAHDDKIRLLGSFLDGDHAFGADVPDPYYGGDAGFEHVLDMIEAACPEILDHLLTLAEAKART